MKKRVLFLCQGNSCHSQMAEGLLKHFRGGEYEVYSAGVKPVEVDRNAVEVMNEIGIDISRQTSKHINKFLTQKFDIIITFGDIGKEKEGAISKFFHDAIRIYWSTFDISEGISTQKDLLKGLREVRDDIKSKITKQFKTPSN